MNVERRRLSTIALLFAAAHGLTACGGGDAGTRPDPAAGAPPAPTPAPGPAPAPAPSPAGSYTSDFSLTENPLSENGAWRRANNQWTNVRTAGGIAFGTNGVANTYDDSYALLTGTFGVDHMIEAVVFRDAALAPGPTHEVELRLRSSDDANNLRGYECLFNWYGGVQVFRWNGPFGDVVEVAMTESRSLGRPLVTGDVIKAGIVGSAITLWINGNVVGRASDSTFKTGKPGIAFFIRPGGANALLGLTRVTVTSSN